MQKLRPDMEIGENIRRLRQKNKLTQEDVVARLQLVGIQTTRSSYAKIETNRMNIKVSELVALSRIFQTDFNAFFDGLAL